MRINVQVYHKGDHVSGASLSITGLSRIIVVVVFWWPEASQLSFDDSLNGMRETLKLQREHQHQEHRHLTRHACYMYDRLQKKR